MLGKYRFCFLFVFLAFGLLPKAQFTYLDSAYHLNKYNWEVSYNALKISEDKFILVGYGADSNYLLNIYCINKAGEELWNKVYNLDSLDRLYIYKSALDSDKNIIMGGQYYNQALKGEEGVLAKADSNGILKWINRYHQDYGHNQGFWGLFPLITSNNRYMLIGAASIDSLTANIMIVKTDTNGNELSRWQLGPPHIEAPWGGGIQTSDGGNLFSGSTTKDDTVNHTYGISTIYMVKTDSMGN